MTRAPASPSRSRSGANPCQSIDNLIPIDCQSDVNSVPIRFQSNPINPRLPTSHHSGTNTLTIQSVNPLPIPPFNVNLPVLDQSINPGTILDQSHDNPLPICRSHANLIIMDQSINQLPMRQFNADPPLIHLSRNNPMPTCQSQSDANLTTGTNPTQSRSTSPSSNHDPISRSITNPPIHYKSGDPLTIDQSRLNPPSHDIMQIVGRRTDPDNRGHSNHPLRHPIGNGMPIQEQSIRT